MLRFWKNLAIKQDLSHSLFQASDRRAAFEETKRFTVQSLASVAYQVNTLACALLQTLDLQTVKIWNMTTQVRSVGEIVAIHKEKVARREIGVLTTNKSVQKQPKIITPLAQDQQYQEVVLEHTTLYFPTMNNFCQRLTSLRRYPYNANVKTVILLEGLPPPPNSLLLDEEPLPPPPPSIPTGTPNYESTTPGAGSYPPPPMGMGLPDPLMVGVSSSFERSVDWVPKVYIEKGTHLFSSFLTFFEIMKIVFVLLCYLHTRRTIALYDYDAEKPDELTLRENCVVYVLRKNEDGWFEGVLDGCTGLFPGNYVQAI
uniref:SH3 domain-containing protein n=1 Tax=Parascaris equorum TaxID=6256 RepID=A0A914RE96_PAREQ